MCGAVQRGSPSPSSSSSLSSLGGGESTTPVCSPHTYKRTNAQGNLDRCRRGRRGRRRTVVLCCVVVRCCVVSLRHGARCLIRRGAPQSPQLSRNARTVPCVCVVVVFVPYLSGTGRHIDKAPPYPSSPAIRPRVQPSRTARGRVRPLNRRVCFTTTTRKGRSAQTETSKIHCRIDRLIERSERERK